MAAVEGLAARREDGVYEFAPPGMPVGVSAAAGTAPVVHRATAMAPGPAPAASPVADPGAASAPDHLDGAAEIDDLDIRPVDPGAASDLAQLDLASELDELSGRLYERVKRELRRDLLHGLERRGVVAGRGGLTR